MESRCAGRHLMLTMQSTVMWKTMMESYTAMIPLSVISLPLEALTWMSISQTVALSSSVMTDLRHSKARPKMMRTSRTVTSPETAAHPLQCHGAQWEWIQKKQRVILMNSREYLISTMHWIQKRHCLLPGQQNFLQSRTVH